MNKEDGMAMLRRAALIQGLKNQFRQNLLFSFNGSVFDSGVLIESRTLFDESRSIVIDYDGLPTVIDVDERDAFLELIRATHKSATLRYFLAYENARSNDSAS